MSAEIKARSYESPTSLDTFMACPRQYYFRYLSGIQSQDADYPRICGRAIHKTVETLYKQTKDQRPYYFKSKDSFAGAFKYQWFRLLDEHKESGTLVGEDRRREGEYLGIGVACIQKYWDANVERGIPRPRLVEERFQVTLPESETQLMVVLDQVRQAPLEYIARVRPELISGGELDPSYDPYVIVDLKSGRQSYEPWHFDENPELVREAARQFPLHHGLQATAYTYAYEQVFGKKPIGFWWYHLRSGKGFFSYRDEGHYRELEYVAQHVKMNVGARSFPKHVTEQCQHCDFFKPCSAARLETGDNRQMIVVRASDAPPGIPTMQVVEDEAHTDVLTVPTETVFHATRQKRLGLKGVVRTPKQQPEQTFREGEPGIIQLPILELPTPDELESP